MDSGLLWHIFWIILMSFVYVIALDNIDILFFFEIKKLNLLVLRMLTKQGKKHKLAKYDKKVQKLMGNMS